MKKTITSPKPVASRGDSLLIEEAGRIYLYADSGAITAHFVGNADKFRKARAVLIREGWQILIH